MESQQTVTKAIAVTLKIIGAEPLAPELLRVYLRHLQRFDDETILKALERCQAEIKNRLAIADIVQRCDDKKPYHRRFKALPDPTMDLKPTQAEIAKYLSDLRIQERDYD